MRTTNENLKEFELFTEMIIERIKAISEDWKKPWIANTGMGFPKNLEGRPYNGINSLLLLLHCEKNGYKIPRFCTFAYVQKMNAVQKNLPLVHVKRGEKSFPVLFTVFICIHKSTGNKISFDEYKNLSKEEQAKYNIFPRTKVYRVFNVEQTNIKDARAELWEKLEREYAKTVADKNNYLAFGPVDKMIVSNSWICPIKPTYGDSAYFSIAKNEIVVPEKRQFVDDGSFYGTVFHEMIHSTGTKQHLNRLKSSTFGTDEYAKEELVAELGAALISYRYGISKTLKKESVTYLKAWLYQLKKSPQYLKTILYDVKKAVALVSQYVDNATEDIEQETVQAA